MRLLLVLALAGLVWGSALADEAQQLRVEAAALVQAAERVSSVRERRELLGEARSKLLELRVRYPSESAEIQLFLRTTLSADRLSQMITEGHSPAVPPQAGGRATVRWKMPSTFPGNLVILGTTGKEFVKRIEEVSGGTIQIRFFEPGALVPALEIFDAVSTGAVDAGWSTPGYWAGKVPALQFFTAIPFGPLPGEAIAWLRYGGGNELFAELYAAHNIHPVHCMMVSPEASGWFRTPVESVEDLQGLKMRFFGLGAKVMEKVGVSTQLLAGGDIYPALDLGTIDAAEFAQPVIDFDLGFYQVAKHYYLPGWHQPTSFSEFIVNMDQWQTLSQAQQAQIETTCSESMLNAYALAESLQPDALIQLEERGVTVHQWEPEFLEVFENAWNEVVAEEAAKDVDFARVWASLSEFREKYRTWGDRGYLP